MQTMTDDLSIPSFLKQRREPVKFKSRRWKRLPRPERPAGEMWSEAKRFEVFISEDVPNLAVGLRRVWVVEGRKWARIADAEKRAKIPMSQWARMKAKEVQS
jgi:hypothetical protein